MADRIGTAVLTLTTDAKDFDAGLSSAAARLAGLKRNFQDTGTSLDKVALGMSKAGKEATASAQMIRGMSEVGRTELARLNPPTEQVTTSLSKLGIAAGTFLGQMAFSAVTQLGQGIVQAAKDGAQLASLVESFDRLALSVGATGDAMLGVTRQATRGLISDLNIMQSANKAMLLGLPVTSQEMGKLAQTAVVLGKAMGQDATKSLDDLITALGRSSPMILDNLGLTVKLGEANDNYAAQIGKTAAQLTEAEKKTAFYRAAMEAAEKKTADLGGVNLTFTDHLSRLTTGLGNAASAMARVAVEGEGAKGVMERLADAVSGVAQRIDDLAEARRRLNRPTLGAGAPQGAAGRAGGALLEMGLGLTGIVTEQANIIDQLEAQRAFAMNNQNPLWRAPGAQPLNMAGFGPQFLEANAREIEELEKKTAAMVKATDAAAKLQQKATDLWKEISVTSGEFAFMHAKLQTIPPAIESVRSVAEDSANLLSSRVNPALVMYGNTVTLTTDHVVMELQRQMTAFGGFTSGITGALESLWKGMSGGRGFAGLMNNLGSSIVQGFGNILSGGLTSVINMGVSMAIEGVKKIAGLISGLFQSEETKHVNKPRDQFLAQFGGFEGLAAKLNEVVDWDTTGESLMKALFDADTKQKFSAAQDAILALVDGNKFAKGGIAMKPIAGIFGEAGPEALIPLDRMDTVAGARDEEISLLASAVTRMADRLDRLDRAIGRSVADALVKTRLRTV